MGKGFTPIYILKAADCYEHQTRSLPGWDTSRSRIIIDTIRKLTIKNLPGYDDADWEIDLNQSNTSH